MTFLPTSSWAARAPRQAAGEMAALRTLANLRGCETANELWVRGELFSEELPQQIRLATGAELFSVTEIDELIPWGCRVPVGRLPDGMWMPLAELLTPNFPQAGFASRRHPTCGLRLMRSDQTQEADILEVDLATWARFVRSAPWVRLSRWEFAASASGRVLVRGLPLPALPGRRYWQAEGLLISVGYRWFPAVAANVVRRILRLSPEEWALWSAESARWERIPAEAFVPVRRENVHQTVIERSAAVERRS